MDLLVLREVHLQARFNATHICFPEAALDRDKGRLDELREMLVLVALGYMSSSCPQRAKAYMQGLLHARETL